MRPGFRTESGQNREGEGRPVELVRVRGAQRVTGPEGYRLKARSRRRGGRGRRRGRSAPPPPQKLGFLGWLKSLFAGKPAKAPRAERREASLDRQEERVLAEFMKTYGTVFNDPGLLKLALTHRSYLSVTGQGPRESNERLEFLGDSVLGLVTSEYLYRRHPDEHEGQLTKTKSLLVSKAILSRRALRMGLGRFVLMSHSEVESGGRQRLSILADAFESVLGAIYLDQGFEAGREFIHKHLLADSDEIVADKRHTNYKSHLQEYVQSTYRTHPVYRIRSEYGPDHSKHFMVEVLVGRRTLGEGRGHNKKEAEQAAARDALENVKRLRDGSDEEGGDDATVVRSDERDSVAESRRKRRRRGGRGRPGAGSGQEDEAERSTQAGVASAGVVEEYESEEDAVADEQGFDVEVVSPGREAAGGERDAADDTTRGRDEGAIDDLDETADDEIDDEAEDADEDEDGDEFDDEGEDDGEEADDDVAAAPEPPSRRAAVTVEPAVVASAPAPPGSPYGRSLRRATRRPAEPPRPVPQVAPSEPAPVHEELHLDPFDPGPSTPEVVIDPAAEERAERQRLEAEQRATEMAQAMDNFGQRRPDTFGRKGRPARRGR